MTKNPTDASSGPPDPIFEEYPEPTLIVDRHSRVLMANRAARALLGEVNGAPTLLGYAGDVFDCVHARQPAGCGYQDSCQACVVRRSVEHAFAIGTVRRARAVLNARRAGGDVQVSMLVSAFPIPHEDGRRVVVTLEDVSDLVHLRDEVSQAERALRESEALYRSLFTLAPSGVVLVGEGGRFLAFNDQAHLQLGYTRAEFEKLRLADIHPEEQRAMVELRMARIRGTGAEEYECRHRTKLGEIRNILVKARTVEIEGRPCLISVWEDITERARAEEELRASVDEQRKLQEQFQQAQKLESIGRLAGGVAHDFNNLLTVILSGVEALKEDVRRGLGPDPEVVQEVGAAGERACELTRQLLAFARRQVIAPVPLDLNALLRRSEKLLRRVLGEDVELVVKLEPGLWPVRCDPGQIEQVILNLAVNARDAMPRGGTLTLETRNMEVDVEVGGGHAADPSLRPGSWIRLSIRDSGEGMSPEVKAHVFEPFFTTKPVGRGTGLGLATVYGIVRQNDGHASVESEPGRGTTFELLFPRTAEPVTAAAPAAPATATRGTETVLVVEDDPQVRAVTVRSLRRAGYRVLVAAGGAEALGLAAREPLHVDVLVTDVIMPGLDGRAVADELRRHHPELRVLYVSGHAEEFIANRGVLEPGMEFLPKPFTEASLLARVRAILDGRSR